MLDEPRVRDGQFEQHHGRLETSLGRLHGSGCLLDQGIDLLRVGPGKVDHVLRPDGAELEGLGQFLDGHAHALGEQGHGPRQSLTELATEFFRVDLAFRQHLLERLEHPVHVVGAQGEYPARLGDRLVDVASLLHADPDCIGCHGEFRVAGGHHGELDAQLVGEAHHVLPLLVLRLGALADHCADLEQGLLAQLVGVHRPARKVDGALHPDIGSGQGQHFASQTLEDGQGFTTAVAQALEHRGGALTRLLLLSQGCRHLLG